jgi:ATP-dependent DNA ligase
VWKRFVIPLHFVKGAHHNGPDLDAGKTPAADAKHKIVAYSTHRLASGTKFLEEAEGKGLEGIMAKRADSKYLSGARTDNWLKIKTSKRQEVVIAGFTAPRGTRPYSGR